MLGNDCGMFSVIKNKDMNLNKEEIETLIAVIEDAQRMAQSEYSSDIDEDEKALLKRAKEALNITPVIKSYSEKEMDMAYDKGFSDGLIDASL